MNMKSFRQGRYRPVNPDKYMGNIDIIRFMSSWELSVHKFFDTNPNVLKWNSEGLRIPYLKPTDGKVHIYLPDYWVQYKKKDGTIVEEVIEVKPDKQRRKSRARNPKRKLLEDINHAVNIAKWKAAKKYANDRGWGFRILTEKDIFR